MRRQSSFYIPSLLLTLFLQAQFLELMAQAAGPTTAISPTGGTGSPASLGTVITSGTSTIPTNLCTANCVITGGTRAGNNLFHSFGNFNIASTDGARFQTGLVNPLPDASVANILGRITAGTPSSIYGNLNSATFYPSANLFLMNPAGFLFGPNATVNVGGMVSFTSADYLKFGDGKLFTALPSSSDGLLSTAPVAAYGFLGSNPGAITVEGSQLAVTSGISLIGGDITIKSATPDGGAVQSAKLSAPGGQINVASVASPGEIVAGTFGQATNINGQSFSDLGAIQSTEQSAIDVSGNGGGTALIRGGQFLLDHSTISANVTGSGPIVNGAESIGSGIDVQVSGKAVIQNLGVLETNVTGNATPGVEYGGVQIKADRIEVLGTVTFEDAFSGNGDFSAFTGIRSNISPDSSGGNSGAITLDANSILINNFAQLETRTEGAGNAGNIIARANQDLETDFGFVGSGATFSTGDAGNIELSSSVGNISLASFSFLASQTIESPGTAGILSLLAPNGNITIGDGTTINMLIQPPLDSAGIRTVRAGGSGGILIKANNLDVIGSEIGITNGSNQPAGNFTINLSGSLNVRAGSFFPSLIRALSQGPASSAGMSVTAHEIVITDGASVSTSTLTEGDAGPLNISAVNLEVTNAGRISSASRQGLDPDTGEPAGPAPTGNAGTINIQGLGGPTQSVLIDGVDSAILTNTVGTGHGGSINIASQSLQIQNSGTLSAATSGTASSATGGTITVNAEHVALNSQGLITAETNGIAPAGTVDINTGTLALNSGGQIRSSSGAETQQLRTLASSQSATPLTGGTINIQGQNGNGSQADSVTIDGPGSGVFTQSTGNRPGGDINVLTSQSVAMTNGASVSASSTGTGNAGNIQINAGNQLSMTNSTVTTEANQASGGAIKITTTPSGTVELTNSMISASVLDGSGGGGSVSIDPQFVILQNSQILARAVQGSGGNINITITNGGLFLPDGNSRVDASSQFGQNGAVTIQAPIAPAGGKIQPLGKAPLQVTALLSQRCAAIARGEVSSFVMAGRDTLPTEPGGWLPSPLAFGASEAGSAVQAGDPALSSEAPDPTLLSLRRLPSSSKIAQMLSEENWISGCGS